MEATLELGPDCLWVVTTQLQGTYRQAWYPWDAVELASAWAGEAWLADALAHLSSIEGGGSGA